ncbi:MAG: uracil-DNA glycosylase [Elusimicrobia bacterium]|nr:uracil-DNA glycosylase [Elusimicrobiota bacterium]
MALSQSSGRSLETLRSAVASCRRCPLGFSRTQAVFGVGSECAKVMWIGEGPGFEEDRRGEPFVGRAGQLLDNILASIGLSRRTVYITNVVKCHPMVDPGQPQRRGNDRPPTEEEIAACRPYLEEQIRRIRPQFIVLLGSVATRAVLRTDRRISELRGRWCGHPGFPEIRVLPTYHPAALLRRPELKSAVWQDMKALRKELAVEDGLA